ncbi:MAG: substrate-binding domain-containing protein [Bacillota bacterium]
MGEVILAKDLLFGISMPTMTHPIRRAEIAMAEEWRKNHPNVKFVVTDGRLDASKQISDIEDLIARKVDVILVAAHQSPTLIPVLKKAKKAGIPVVAFDRRLTDTDLFVTYVGSDDREFGRLCAQFIAKKLEGKGNVVILEGVQGGAVTIARQEGFMEEIKKYPGIKIVSDQVANFQRVQAVSVMENVLQAHPDIDAIFSHNDEMALGALQVLKAAGKKGVIIAGVDGQKEAIKAIIDGEMHFTAKKVLEFPTAAEVALKIINGEKVKPEYILPTVAIDATNAKEQYDPDSIF